MKVFKDRILMLSSSHHLIFTTFMFKLSTDRIVMFFFLKGVGHLNEFHTLCTMGIDVRRLSTHVFDPDVNINISYCTL